MRLRRYRSIAMLLLGLHLSACATWQPVTVGPRELVEEEEPSAVRVTRMDGTRIEVERPQIRADSISPCEQMVVQDGRAVCQPGTAVALRDVQAIEVRSESNGGAALVVGVLGAVLIGVVVSVLLEGEDFCVALCPAEN